MVLTVDVRKWLGGKGCDRLRDARGEWLVASQGTQTASALVLLLLARLPRETLNKRSPCQPQALQRNAFGWHGDRLPAWAIWSTAKHGVSTGR